MCEVNGSVRANERLEEPGSERDSPIARPKAELSEVFGPNFFEERFAGGEPDE